jgi:hypothetical protein
MKVTLWVGALAAAFWNEVGEEEPFPRSLVASINRALPLDVVYDSQLRLVSVLDWLKRNHIACPCYGPDRSLRACLVARYGNGFVFIDEADPENERRFSLAHELGHFLHEYWEPRRQVAERLGANVLEVFDGKRAPTNEERIDAILAKVPIGFHMHLLERDTAGRVVNVEVERAERDADLLAYELLAPAGAVLASVEATPRSHDRRSLIQLLQEVYGLPGVQSQEYSRILMPETNFEDPLLRRLGLRSCNSVEHPGPNREQRWEGRE